ncbi:MAG: hypothetical protein HY901_08195 [Deltaproteobacteria bacterium]|nr:hypothetical protein [Deltaproteobacteria bacterium]
MGAVGTSARVVNASFLLERGAEARALLKLGFETTADFEDALQASGWTVHRGRDGAIDDIDFSGVAFTRGFNAVLSKLGPFVSAGSFILLEGEDGAQCRWDFDGRRCSFVDAGLVEMAG